VDHGIQSNGGKNMRSSLNIFFYTDTFLPAVDGAVTSMLGFKDELESRGHRVVIVASGNKKTKELVKKDKNIIVVPSVKFRRYPQYNFALMPFMAASKIGVYDADIVHMQTPFTVGTYGLLVAKMGKIPSVGSFHTLFTKNNVIKEYGVSNPLARKLFLRYAWPYARFFYGSCTRVIAPSASIKSLLVKQKVSNNIDVVPNGVDTKRFNPKVKGSALKHILTGDNESALVLYMGRISREKNIGTMLSAAKMLSKKRRKIKFVIAGTGPAMDQYIRYVHRNGLERTVKFVGFVSERELPKYYAAADVLCMPSTFETQGIVSLEAMASGKPVVGADYLALRDLIVNGKNGEKFKPLDYRDCAMKIEKVINNLSSYKECVKTAREYSIAKVTDGLLKTYSTAIEDSAKRKNNSLKAVF
jgi:1,2-diacylglycerol 3-alpha-glucosyltransferase